MYGCCEGAKCAAGIVWRYTLAMVRSAATNVDQYLGELPEERREVMAALRKLIRKHLPKGYVESMTSGSVSKKSASKVAATRA